MSGSAAWTKLRSHAKDLFSVELGDDELAKLDEFLGLVETWSDRMNLVGPAAREELIERHLLDSFAPAGLLGPAKSIVDYGSGAGFPAIPLAILLPSVKVHLVESRRKRCSFLRHVARTLQLSNVAIWESRGEEWQPPQASIDAAIGRALAIEKLAGLATGVLPVGGRLLVMRKQDAARALDGFTEVGLRRYRLPGGQRHEVAAYERLP